MPSAIDVFKHQLEAFPTEDQWQVDHLQAMFCLDIESLIDSYIKVIESLDNRFCGWHNDLFHGRTEFSEVEESKYKDAFSAGIVAGKSLQVAVAILKSMGFEPAGVDELSRSLRHCEGIASEMPEPLPDDFLRAVAEDYKRAGWNRP